MSGHRIYSIAYGRTKEHADAIVAGLSELGPHFAASVCWGCKGKGERTKRYIEGPGTFACQYCDGLGLQQCGKPAHESVLNQVLNASLLRRA